MTVNVKFGKENSQKSTYYNFSFFFDMLACLQQNFQGRVLSIRVFSANEHYALIVSLRGLTRVT